jgi:hypothetical protein
VIDRGNLRREIDYMCREVGMAARYRADVKDGLRNERHGTITAEFA